MSRKKPKNTAILVPMAVGVGVTVMLVVKGLVMVNDDGRKSGEPSSAPVPRSVSTAVDRVADQFVCSCGECGEEPLRICDCPTAFEELGFIQRQLEAGRTENEAADALQAEYGGRKSNDTQRSNPSPPGLSAGQIAALLSGAGGATNRFAASADSDHIISHFKCPCEQCAIDELRDCECAHKNGAQEVKRFIAATIAKRQHTVGEVVALVEQRYGGRIR